MQHTQPHLLLTPVQRADHATLTPPNTSRIRPRPSPRPRSQVSRNIFPAEPHARSSVLTSPLGLLMALLIAQHGPPVNPSTRQPAVNLPVCTYRSRTSVSCSKKKVKFLSGSCVALETESKLLKHVSLSSCTLTIMIQPPPSMSVDRVLA
jgi:hypothetical protein